MPHETSKVQWEDPPPARTGFRKNEAFFAELKANPARWAKFPALKSTIGPRRKEEGFEQKVVRIDGHNHMWVRYNPTGKPVASVLEEDAKANIPARALLSRAALRWLAKNPSNIDAEPYLDAAAEEWSYAVKMLSTPQT